METWRAIPGYEGVYEVSDRGRVRSLARVVVRRNGRQQTLPARVLAGKITEWGYRVYHLRSRDKQGRIWPGHRAVLEAFVGPRPPGMECRHLDGDPATNRLVNLVWGTHVANVRDTTIHGTDRKTFGEAHPKAKLTEAAVREIRAAHATELVLAKRYKVDQATIHRVRTRRSWRHVE